MKLLKHLITFLALQIFQLIGAVIIGIALLFIPKEQTKLPKYLRWFDNHETYWDGPEAGLNGTLDVNKQSWFSRWNWLCWRNPINYFQYRILGVKWSPAIRIIKYDPLKIKNVGDDKGEGTAYTEIRVDNKVIWEFRYTKAYLNKKKCFDLRLGWKITELHNNKVGRYISWVFNFRPFVNYTGK